MKIRRKKFDVIMNILCLICLVCTVIFLVVIWTKIPDKVPMHYDSAGNIDRWGSKSEMIILPVMTWVMYVFLTVIEHFPQAWNTGVKVTEENMGRVYSTVLHMLSSMKFIIVAMFTYLTIHSAIGFGLSAWFLPVSLVAAFGNLVFWIWRTFKVR